MVLHCTIDPSSPEFTLEKIISLGFDLQADKICEVSGAASKELSIEQVPTQLGLYCANGPCWASSLFFCCSELT